jgi:hypothetical protein
MGKELPQAMDLLAYSRAIHSGGMILMVLSHQRNRRDEDQYGQNEPLHYPKISGNKTKVENKPPMKKPITATKDGSWRLESPLMACPEVHPPA